MKSGRGGARKHAGRPRIGVARALKITLPQEEWERIDRMVEDGQVRSQAEYFRQAHLVKKN